MPHRCPLCNEPHEDAPTLLDHLRQGHDPNDDPRWYQANHDVRKLVNQAVEQRVQDAMAARES